MDLVNRLKYYMDHAQVTISQFADRCGIPRPTMSQLINGRNKRISDEVISKIHNAFPDLSVLWLMFGEGDMTTNANIETSEPQIDAKGVPTPYQTTDTQHHNPQNSNGETCAQEAPSSETFENLLFETPQDEPFRINASQIEDSAPKDNILFETSPACNDKPSTPHNPPHTIPAQADNHHDITRTLGAHIAPSPANSPKTETSSEEKRISISPDAHKKITNIVVFYSDNSFQSFLPDS